MVISYLINKGEYDPNKDLGYTPAPSHRLDRNTAGLILFGKNIATLRYLATIMQDKNIIEKRYLTLVVGRLEKDGEINLPLEKNSKNGRVFVSDNGNSLNYNTDSNHIKVYSNKNYGGAGGFTRCLIEAMNNDMAQYTHFIFMDDDVVLDRRFGNVIEDVFNLR